MIIESTLQEVKAHLPRNGNSYINFKRILVDAILDMEERADPFELSERIDTAKKYAVQKGMSRDRARQFLVDSIYTYIQDIRGKPADVEQSELFETETNSPGPYAL